MNFSMADIPIIIEGAQSLESPWRERVIGLCQDWMTMLKEEFGQMQRGLDISKTFKSGTHAVAQLDAIEEILKMPLCEPCRKLIGGDHFSADR